MFRDQVPWGCTRPAPARAGIGVLPRLRACLFPHDSVRSYSCTDPCTEIVIRSFRVAICAGRMGRPSASTRGTHALARAPPRKQAQSGMLPLRYDLLHYPLSACQPSGLLAPYPNKCILFVPQHLPKGCSPVQSTEHDKVSPKLLLVHALSDGGSKQQKPPIVTTQKFDYLSYS